MSPAKRKPEGQDPGFIQFDETPAPQADPAVSALLSQRERVQREARLPKKAREKKIRERERMQARAEGHTCYDIPPELRAWVKSLGEELGVPASQIAALALLRFARDYQEGQVDLSSYKTPSRSPRFDWNLNLRPEEFGVGPGKQKQVTLSHATTPPFEPVRGCDPSKNSAGGGMDHTNPLQRYAKEYRHDATP